jgi:malonyl CoA-acyl carrier protein transacylase
MAESASSIDVALKETSDAFRALKDVLHEPRSDEAAGPQQRVSALTAAIKKAKRHAALANAAVLRAGREFKRAGARASAERELLRHELHNERLDIAANATRVFVRLQASAINGLDKRLEESVRWCNGTVGLLNDLVEKPSGVGVDEIQGPP